MFMTRTMAAALALLSVGLLVASVGLLVSQAAAGQGVGSPITSRNAAPQGPASTAPERAPRAGDPAQRVRELIYFFRTYRVFCRDEEWAQTIRELAAIGKDAVPELVAELDRTDRDATLRSLAFTLRAIGDPRAVPGLIRAIPKALRRPGSDCGVQIVDRDLRAFMRAHQDYKNDQSQLVACGRPVNEILTALERITKHGEFFDWAGNDVRHIFLAGTLEQQARKRASFEQCRQRWEAWWSEHWPEFATLDELRSVELPQRDTDLAERDGVGRYGALFPTGPGVRLGPVHMVRLTTSEYANGKSTLDFDSGRTFALYEGNKAAEADRSDPTASHVAWYRRNGIDIHQQGSTEGIDLHLWLVDDSRWATLEAEVRKDEPLPLGREATDTLARFEKNWTDFKFGELATFLFTTREGGRGIVQVFPRDPDGDRYRLRYRVWTTAQAGPSARAAAQPRRANAARTPFGRIVTATLELPADGRECLLDLETGRKAGPPDFLRPHEMANTFSLTRDERFIRWCRDQGLDLLGRDTSREREVRAERVGPAVPLPAPAEPAGEPPAPAEPAAEPPAPAAPSRSEYAELVAIEMTMARIIPQWFDELTVEEAREILERTPHQPRAGSIGFANHLIERPDTFAFQTREGAVGLLQMQTDAKDPGKLTIRYRLEPRK
jgi:hypothetical protein